MQTTEVARARISVAAELPRRRNRFLRRLIRDKFGFLSAMMAIALLAVAIGAPWLTPSDPYAIEPRHRLESPSREHLMGTDEMGRDILSRAILGARVSIGIALAVTLVGVALGVLIGTLAGLAGGFIDELAMRVTDIFLAVPLLVLAMAVSAALGSGIVNAAIAMCIVWWPGYARQARAEVLRIKVTGYVESARAVGVPIGRLVIRHILPNAFDPILVRMSTTIGYIMLTTAALSFIGLGTQPPTPDWGNMISISRQYLMSYPWYPLVVGLPLFITVFFVAFAGDAVGDAMEASIE